ncbi:MAG: hypothetical protein ACJA01_002019 [Saprospiraceae bacterium]|jgi:hypothetical protein
MFRGYRKRRVLQNFTLIGAFVMSQILFVFGQSPANLNSDINASNGFSTASAIEATYNNARRQEEIQLGLGANAITNLNLPSQSEWNSYSEDKKALFLLNDERTSRKGINYGQGAVRGYSFEGVAQKVDQVSQAYAQVLMNNDAFTHTYSNTSPSSRISNGVGSSCKEFISRSENLYGAVSTANSGFPNVVAQAMYGFIYDDAGSNWGHREMCLLQDKDLSGNNWGFSDNHGIVQEEGLIGIGIVRGTNWSAFGSNWPYGVVLVMNYFDPVASGCNYTLLETTGSTIPSGAGGPDPCPTLLSFANEDVDGIHKSATQITIITGTQITGPTVFAAPEININGTFEVIAGNCLEFSDKGCQYTGTIECDPPLVTVSGAGTCSEPFSMVCGTVLQGNTNQNTNNWSSYGQSGGWTGPEAVFTIEQPAGSVITITLDQLQADLDLILIQPCSNTPLFSSAKSGTSDEMISVASVVAARTLHVVIDGYLGAISEYRMSLSCPTSAGDKVSNIGQKSIGKITKKESMLIRVGEPYLEKNKD